MKCSEVLKRNIIVILSVLFMLSCSSRKNPSEVDDVAVMDSILTDTLHRSSQDEFMDDHIPPPPPPDGKHSDGPPPHGKGRPPHGPDNMRGFDPASEDDMEDNGMSRYMENYDEEGWD